MVSFKSPKIPDPKEFLPGEFENHKYWFPKALNATIHPMIHFFMNLEQNRIINRYCHLHPKVNAVALKEILMYKPKYFLWAGADLLNVTSAGAKRQMVIIENNSCPSGQKSMPLLDDTREQGGYRLLVERTFKPLVDKRNTIQGGLAVLFDKNEMETSGYASVIADVFQEPVWWVPFFQNDPNPPVRFVEGVMEIRTSEGIWKPIRAAFRYVTQKPWNRIPLSSKTKILNPVVACLAGGRNKMVASKAYDLFNGELDENGLHINTPETIWDVSKTEIPFWVKKLGGQAVVKVPYSNAGQGVYTIVSEEELNHFMSLDFTYDRFIVQSLIGNYQWSSSGKQGKLYHVGTIPNSKGKTYVADLRMMVSASENGMQPLAVYARRAAKPLEDVIEKGTDSWSMLGTNLSFKNEDGSWGSDSSRLILMDRRDFNRMGLGLDDLIEAYIQTVLSMVAIDKMAVNLVSKQGKFKHRLFKAFNNDDALLDEILKE